LNVPRIAELLAVIDPLVVGIQCGRQITGKASPAEMAQALSQTREVAVVTDGEHGCWFASHGQAAHQAAFEVEVVDTTVAAMCFTALMPRIGERR
jgi:sugar/nucleoside kinase (ribokinase family)